MKAPELPENEAGRLETLRSYKVLDTVAEADFDDLVRIAAHVLGTPMAAVSLVDTGRQWFKAKVGLSVSETPRDISFCGHAVADNAALVVPDAAQDERFSDNPLVIGGPRIRFYAGVPLRAPNGHALGTLCVISDEPMRPSAAELDVLAALARQAAARLDQRRQMLELQRVSRERAEEEEARRRFFALSLDLLCIARFDGFFEEVNPAWESALGFSVAELKGEPFVNFVHPDDVAATEAEVRRLASGGSTVAFENRWRTKDGSYRWYLWNVAVDEEKQTMMAVGRDVGEIRATNEALREAKMRAEALGRVKSRFLANMSHELRTPLNSVIGFTNVLRKNKSGNLSAVELDFLRRIQDNGRHLVELINDVLDLSKIEAGNTELRREDVALPELIRHVVGQLQGKAEEASTTLRIGGLPNVATVSAVPRLISQILINLIGNGLKFAQGGLVEVRLVQTVDGRPMRVEVSDSGPGIPADKFDEIFGSFQQADDSVARKFGGTGLGLTISRSLALQLGFDIEVASVEGEGATFALRLVADAPALRFTPPAGP